MDNKPQLKQDQPPRDDSYLDIEDQDEDNQIILKPKSDRLRVFEEEVLMRAKLVKEEKKRLGLKESDKLTFNDVLKIRKAERGEPVEPIQTKEEKSKPERKTRKPKEPKEPKPPKEVKPPKTPKVTKKKQILPSSSESDSDDYYDSCSSSTEGEEEEKETIYVEKKPKRKYTKKTDTLVKEKRQVNKKQVSNEVKENIQAEPPKTIIKFI